MQTGDADSYLKPNLVDLPATAAELAAAEQYTRICPIVREDAPDAHTAWLVVENQYFCVTPQSCDTAAEASWHCWMLAKAVLKILRADRV
jgi:hypothetical protein